MSNDRQQCSDDWKDLTSKTSEGKVVSFNLPIVIFDKKFEGWESLQDWDRDLSEAMQVDYNPALAPVPPYFDGTIHVVIVYQPKGKK
jgi:hypothetical protein